MSSISSLAETAALIGEPARTAMLVALIDGRSLAAGELARTAGISAQTASGHLARLEEAGLLAVSAQGRHRYYRLATPAVGRMLETMMGVAGLVEERRRTRPIVTGPRDAAMRHARVCYDHLAGEVAVAIADALAARGDLDLSHDGAALTAQGREVLTSFGLDLGKASGPTFCRPCMDWSERRPHLAGRVGRELLRALTERHWLVRASEGRAVRITPAGVLGLEQQFGLRIG